MEMCRVCLSTEKGMHPFDETFVIQYNLLTNLNISLLDGMPQYSCKTCLNTLKHFIEFREKSLASEATLRDIICSDHGSDNKPIEIECKTESKIEDVNELIALKNEIKEEIEDDSVFNAYDGVSFEEYGGDFKDLVKDEDQKPPPKTKKTRKKKKKEITKLPETKKGILDSDSWFCGICPKAFEDQIEMINHLDMHKNDRQCELCKETMNSTSQLYAHRLMHVPPKQLNCHICNKRFKACLYLEYHYRNMHIDSDDSKLLCDFCQLTYSSPKKLKSHKLHVHSDIKFICDVCSKAFTNKANLKSHIRLHSKVKAFVCDICGYACKYSGGLKDHKIRRHSQKKIYCKNCARPFSSQGEYERHKCKNKTRVCPVCGVQITGTSRLSKHMLRHSDVHPYECRRCPAKYKSKAALIAHTDRHDGNRTKQCEYCSAKFYTTTVLIKHRRTHTGEKPYVCKVCSRGFTGRHNLKVHMKVHGEYLVIKRDTEPDLSDLTK